MGISILAIAAGRCVSNGSTADQSPDPFWNFSIIVLLGESENRLSIILGSIPIFWPMIEKAVENVRELYRIRVTQEIVVHSSRVLPGEVTIEWGAYEAPHWAEEAGEGARSRNGSLGGHEKDAGPHASFAFLPEWPVSPNANGALGETGDSRAPDSEQNGANTQATEGN